MGHPTGLSELSLLPSQPVQRSVSGQQELPMPTVRHWFLSMCPMEWKSTKLPARSCKVTAAWLAMLRGGGEEAEREAWVLKVPCAGPLLHWLPLGMLPILLCFLSTLREPDRGTQHLTTFEGSQDDGNSKR